MRKIVTLVASLLLAVSLLLMGSGLLGTLTGIRATLEGFSDTLTGIITSAYFIGFILGNYIVPLLLKRVGHIRTFAALTAMASICVIAQGYIISPASWLLLRLLLGVCLVGVYIVVESWLNELTDNTTRGKTLSTYQSTTLIALALGQYLILLTDVTTSALFVLSGALFVLGIIPVALTKLSEPVVVNTGQRLDLKELYLTSPMAILGAMTAGLVNGAFLSLAAVSAYHLGLDKGEIAVFMSAMILGGVFLQWPIGHYSDKADRRKVMALAATGGIIFSLLIVVFFHWFRAGIVFAAFLYGGMVFVLYPIGAAHLNDTLPREKFVLAARGMSLSYGIGAATGPICVGILMNLTGPYALYIFDALLLAVLAGTGFYRVRHVALPETEREAFVPLVRTSTVALEMHPQSESPDSQ